MKPKILVRGKSQSRTALGIINAYLKLYPNSTLSDLQQAFPKSLNSKSITDNIIVPVKEAKGYEKQFIEREVELIVLKSGEKLSLIDAWRKEDFDAICEHAKQYGIKVADTEDAKPFKKRSYQLEYLNEFVPMEEIAFPPESDDNQDENENKNKNENEKKGKSGWRWWILLLILLLLVLILLFWWKKYGSNDKSSTTNNAPVENTTPAAVNTPDSVAVNSVAVDSIAVDSVAVTPGSSANNLVRDEGDTLSITLDGKEWKIGKNSPEYRLFSFLNAKDTQVDADTLKGWITLDKMYFKKGRTNLSPESDSQLENIAVIMQFFPNSKIKVGGYTDNTGKEAANLKLSSERAKNTAKEIISLGVKANRVTSEGYGSEYPVCPENDTPDCRNANRRIDIKVIKK